MSGVINSKRFQYIEIQTKANYGAGGKLMIGDQPQLRTQDDQRVIVTGIETYDINVVPLSPQGLPLPSTAELSNAFLVLNIQSYETLQYIPMAALQRVQSAATATQRFWIEKLFEFDRLWGVDWTKSYIQFAAAQASGVSFALGVHYYYLPQDSRFAPNNQGSY